MTSEPEILLFLQHPIQVVRKFRARRLTLSIRPDRPMRLTSNYGTSKSEIMNFLNSHSGWIEKNIQKIQEIEIQYQKPTLQIGSLFPFLGELKYFIFSCTNRKRPVFQVEDGFLICYLPQNKKSGDYLKEELENLLHKFYKKQGVEHLQKRTQFWSVRTGLMPTQLKFNRATTRWGSCNSKKQLNLNWKLICHAPHLIDYVIVHELCHLRHMNHSASFWELVAHFMPEYKTYEKILDEQTQLSRFLNAVSHVSN